ncbi:MULTISPECIES: hypothetical protein [unclassified Nostoc]|nr:hypothetical protein [Nostoc sp. S13]MDF5735969.1 hypothetical protein [Nostoc sp. S13]
MPNAALTPVAYSAGFTATRSLAWTVEGQMRRLTPKKGQEIAD